MEYTIVFMIGSTIATISPVLAILIPIAVALFIIKIYIEVSKQEK